MLDWAITPYHGAPDLTQKYPLDHLRSTWEIVIVVVVVVVIETVMVAASAGGEGSRRGEKREGRRENLITLWRIWVAGYHQGLSWTDLPLARQVYQKPSHHYLSVGKFRKDMGDLVEGFQRITSAKQLLSSCAVFATVTSSSTISPAIVPCLHLSLPHNNSPLSLFLSLSLSLSLSLLRPPLLTNLSFSFTTTQQ